MTWGDIQLKSTSGGQTWQSIPSNDKFFRHYMTHSKQIQEKQQNSITESNKLQNI
jgi:hypothetical protein